MLGLQLFPPLLPQTKPICKVYLILTECIFWWTNASIKVFFSPSHLNSLHYSLEENFLQKKLITIREITAHQSPTQLNVMPINELLPNDMNCPIFVWQVSLVVPTSNKSPAQKTYWKCGRSCWADLAGMDKMEKSRCVGHRNKRIFPSLFMRL